MASSSGVREVHEQGFNRAPGRDPAELNTLLSVCVCESETERHETSKGVMKSLPPTGLSDCCQLDPAPVNPSPPRAQQARAPRACV